MLSIIYITAITINTDNKIFTMIFKIDGDQLILGKKKLLDKYFVIFIYKNNLYYVIFIQNDES